MDIITKLQNITKENGGIITTSKAAGIGISHAVLSKLYRDNKYRKSQEDDIFLMTISRMNCSLSGYARKRSYVCGKICIVKPKRALIL